MRHLTGVLIGVFILLASGRFIPRKENVHFDRVSIPRRWGRWCTEDMECGHGVCRAFICQCQRGYLTWRRMDVCNYQQRTKLVAFLLSFFVGLFGIDWFVLSRGRSVYIITGVIKLLISSACILGWPIVIVKLSKTKRDLALLATAINVTLSLTSFLWWLTDWIRVLAEVFYDGNGAPLLSWGYNYNHRFLYRM